MKRISQYWKRRIKAVERPERRKGIELYLQPKDAGNKPPEAKEPGICSRAKMAIYLLFTGWRPNELGLWIKRTQAEGHAFTETYCLKTAYKTETER